MSTKKEEGTTRVGTFIKAHLYTLQDYVYRRNGSFEDKYYPFISVEKDEEGHLIGLRVGGNEEKSELISLGEWIRYVKIK